MTKTDVIFKSKPNKFTIIISLMGLGIVGLFFYQFTPILVKKGLEDIEIIMWIMILIFLGMGLGTLWMLFQAFLNVKLTQKELFIYVGIKKKRIPINEITDMTLRFPDGGNHTSRELIIYTKNDKDVKINSLKMGNFWQFITSLSTVTNKEVKTIKEVI